jgi:hypothetical protein
VKYQNHPKNSWAHRKFWTRLVYNILSRCMTSCILAIARCYDAEARSSRFWSYENSKFSLCIHIKGHAVCLALFCCIVGVELGPSFRCHDRSFNVFLSQFKSGNNILILATIISFSSLTLQHVLLFEISSFWREVAENWVITQWVVVICYRRFGTIYPSHPQAGFKNLEPCLRMGPIGCPENLVRL